MTVDQPKALSDAQLRDLRLIISHEPRTVRRPMAEKLERFGLVRIRHLHPHRCGWVVVATDLGLRVSDHGGVIDWSDYKNEMARLAEKRMAM